MSNDHRLDSLYQVMARPADRFEQIDYLRQAIAKTERGEPISQDESCKVYLGKDGLAECRKRLNQLLEESNV